MVETRPISGSQTLASQAYHLLRHDILNGTLPPSRKLKIETLKQEYNIGISPIREALNRLSREGLVSQIDQLGFRVQSVSREELIELVNTRCWLTETALRQSIANGGEEWEEKIILTHFRLSKTTKFNPSQTLPTAEWEDRHWDFHFALLSGCGSSWLLGFLETLSTAFNRYRFLIPQPVGPARDIAKEHEEIMEAVTSRRAEEAVKLLEAHLRTTADQVMLTAKDLLASPKPFR